MVSCKAIVAVPKGKAKAKSKARAAAPQSRDKVSRDFMEGAIEKAISELCAELQSDHDQVFPCLQAVREGFFKKKGAAHTAEQWPSSYVRFDQIPKYWL